MSNIQKYIVRSEKAGVFYAEIKERRGSEIDLTDARRIYYWQGAATCSQIAVDGIAQGSKVTCSVPEMTVFGVIEVIPCSEKAVASINGVPVWKV